MAGYHLSVKQLQQAGQLLWIHTAHTYLSQYQKNNASNTKYCSECSDEFGYLGWVVLKIGMLYHKMCPNDHSWQQVYC